MTLIEELEMMAHSAIDGCRYMAAANKIRSLEKDNERLRRAIVAYGDASRSVRDRCPFCGWVWCSSIDHDEYHGVNCLYIEVKTALNK